MAPLIGIPPCLDARGRWRSGRDYHYLDGAYAAAVNAAGGTAVLLPQVGSANQLAERIDGLLVPGGDDLPPERGYPDTVHFELAPERQLAFDRELIDACLGRDLPVLGICYGMQLLAVAWGGRLHYDLPTDLPDSGSHQLPEPSGRHGLEVRAGSRLAALCGDALEEVNSLHHQGVADSGRAKVSARAADGVVEAIEDPGARFALGVQWHPEKLPGPGGPELFEAFVGACRR